MKYIWILLLPSLLLVGCGDKYELEELGYVIAIGLDKGEKGKIKVTYQIGNPEVGTALIGSPPPEEKAYLTVSVHANDFVSARSTVNAFVSRRLTFSQTQVLIVSEELAKTEEFLRILYSGIRERELRKQVMLLVTKEKAEEFMKKNKPELETRPHKFYQLMLERAQNTGLVPPESDLLHFFETTERDASFFLAIYASTQNDKILSKDRYEDEYLAGEIPGKPKKNTSEFIGSAIFKEGKMIGALTGQETRMALNLDKSQSVRNILATIPDPLSEKERIVCRVSVDNQFKIKMNLNKENPSMDIFFPLKLEILSIPSQINYSTNYKNQEMLEKHIEKYYHTHIMNLINKLKSEYKGEAFNWSLEAQKYFLTQKQYEEFDWMKTYPNMNINLKVEVNIEEFGVQTQSPNFKVVED